MRFAFLVFVAALMSAAAPPLAEPYRSIAALAQSAPPEFAADALLRLAESGKISDREARRDLVEQAFRLAANAGFRVRMRGLPGTTTDTRSGFLSRAYDLKLDALSLQSRAVQDMLAIDAPKARELFQEIPRPAPAPLTCDDPFVYDVADFYQALAAVANTSFTQKERSQEDHIAFLLDYLGQAVSAAQLAPLARAIKTVSASPAQREVLWNRFNGLLESLQPDPRSFSAALPGLASEAVPEIEASLEQFKQRTHACQDGDRVPATQAAGAKTSDAEKTPQLERYWQSPAAKQLLQDGLKLRSSGSGEHTSTGPDGEAAWQEQLANYTSELAAWTSSEEQSEADYYHEKCLVYQALVELIPPGPQREKALADFVTFIGNSSLQEQSPVEWFLEATSMQDRVRGSNHGELAWLADAYERSGGPILALEMVLERTLGPKRPDATDRN